MKDLRDALKISKCFFVINVRRPQKKLQFIVKYSYLVLYFRQIIFVCEKCVRYSIPTIFTKTIAILKIPPELLLTQ